MKPPAPLADHWWHTSGGLVWHARALRHRHRWAPFRAAVAQWLGAWAPARPHLIVVGPSAGWTLPAALPAGFARLTVLEPDPLARLLLRRRWPHAGLQFAACNVFAPGGLAALLAAQPDAALLFANVLGQLAPADHARAWCEALRHTLAGHSWASLHDLVSTARAPDAPGEAAFAAGTPEAQVLARFWHGGRLEVTDHGTAALAGDGPFRAATWALTPRQHHLVAWVQHSPDPGAHD